MILEHKFWTCIVIFLRAYRLAEVLETQSRVDLGQAHSGGCGTMARELGGEWPMSPVAGMTQVSSGKTW